MKKKISPAKRFKGILLSGLPGSGKSTAARELSLLLGWPVFSIGDMWRKQWQELYPAGEISKEEYFKKVTFKEHRAMDTRARKVFEQEHVIGDMRHGIISEGLPILRVFISASVEIRAKRGVDTGRFDGKSLVQIQRLLAKREIAEMHIAQKLYGERYDFRDSSRYHLTINSGLLTVKEKIALLMSFFV